MKRWKAGSLSWLRHLGLSMTATYYTAMCLFAATLIVRLAGIQAESTSLNLLWLCTLAAAIALLLKALSEVMGHSRALRFRR
jgi:hypothetical protein